MSTDSPTMTLDDGTEVHATKRFNEDGTWTLDIECWVSETSTFRAATLMVND